MRISKLTLVVSASCTQGSGDGWGCQDEGTGLDSLSLSAFCFLTWVLLFFKISSTKISL